MERFDCHCHIFNILTVGWKAIVEQLNDVMLLLTDDNGEAVETKHISAENKKKLKEKIKKLAELIKIFTSDSEEIFDMLDKHYDRKYKLFPLMFDGDFLLDADDNEHLQQIKELINESGVELNKQNSENTKKLSIAQQFRSIGEEDGVIILKYLNNLSVHLNPENNSKSEKSGFEIQYEQIKQISENPKYKDRIIPFLGVDPRRENIKSYLDQVGKGKLFAGVKVYPPNGFSPCDKVLVGRDSIFEYCNNNGIPVVSHCSYGGFATLAMSIDVNGMIIPEGKTTPEPYDGKYTFSKGLKSGFSEMVQERAGVLNSPKIWEEVLKKYNKLILVLAHFGNYNLEWQEDILRMMKKYPNLYTDVSCMSEKDTILNVKAIYENNPKIQDKILYGSDYFLDMFKNDSFDQYLERMEENFTTPIFNKLSSENPMKYMAKWYNQQ